MPSSAWTSRSAGCVKYGCSSTWLTAGTTSVRVDQPAEELRAEVRDADRARPAVGEERLGGLVGADRVLEVGRHRLMQQVQVDVVDAEPAQAGLEADLRGVVAVVADPQLGGDEDLVAVDAGAADALADLALVVVGGGGVDQPVAVAQRGLDGGGGLLGRALEDAQAEGGHRDAVVQRQGRGRAGVIVRSSRVSVSGGVPSSWPAGRAPAGRPSRLRRCRAPGAGRRRRRASASRS